MNRYFSWPRFWSIVVKEFIQMKRDRLTFLMMLGLPVMQLVLFGYAINIDPKDLRVAVVSYDESVFSRDVVRAMNNSGYFNVLSSASGDEEAAELLALGKVHFVLSIPPGFSRDLLRGDRPSLLLEADATDPMATGSAIAAMNAMARTLADDELKGPLAHLRDGNPPFELKIHKKYNQEGVAKYNIVPGLLGVVLTLTMVVITAVAITREIERGTMENLLSTPVRPIEVITGKILPYIIVGYVQVIFILLVSHYLFRIPMMGSYTVLMASALVFIAANLSVGITFSTIARNQMQAMQMSYFFFLPSLLLSGFMFPFGGMPRWAQWIGSVFPLTHFLRVVRGVILKGNGMAEVAVHLWPIALFFFCTLLLALIRYRGTLD